MNLENKLALITGASSGIGAATARALAKRGARVLLLARTQTALDALASEINAQQTRAFCYPVDLTDHAAVERVAQEIIRAHGAPEMLINNAGVGRWLYCDETPAPEVAQMMAAPYFAAFYVTRAFLPAMLAQNSGTIVNVNSPACYTPWAGATGYTAARWALRGFTEALRVDLRETNLRVMQAVAVEVASAYWEHNPGARERLPSLTKWFGTLTPDQVAEGIARAIERERINILMPRRYAFIMYWNQFLPFVGERLMRWTSHARAVR
jgi:short-subunit dehydrogenase